MRVALYDVDSKIPNLALMKISAYHKALGDTVEPYFSLMLGQYDKVYASKIFDFSDGSNLMPHKMEIGGTGWGLKTTLPPEIEVMAPDYSFYNYPHSIGFTMRGCRFKCPFCVVSKKEGRPKPASTIAEIWTNRGSDFVVLLDNDFFGNPEWPDRIAEIQDRNLKVCFSQGLNIRTITNTQARSLASIRFTNLKATKKQVYFSWDRIRDRKLVLGGIDTCIKAGMTPRQMGFYVLIGYDTTPEEDYRRVILLKTIGCDPYVMPYNKSDHYQQRFARWVNHKAVFNSVEWGDYK